MYIFLVYFFRKFKYKKTYFFNGERTCKKEKNYRKVR